MLNNQNRHELNGHKAKQTILASARQRADYSFIRSNIISNYCVCVFTSSICILNCVEKNDSKIELCLCVCLGHSCRKGASGWQEIISSNSGYQAEEDDDRTEIG